MFEVVERVKDAKARQIRATPCHTTRASAVGHPCLRYLVYMRTHWEHQRLHDVVKEFLFDLGRAIERVAIQELMDAGFHVLEQNRAFLLRREELSGHIDALVAPPGNDHQPVPCEIKGLQHYDWEALNSLDDFLNSRKVWIRKYPGQLLVYMYQAGIPEGFFYIKSKLTGEPKEIWFQLGEKGCSPYWDVLAEMLARAEQVKAHIAADTFPDRIKDDSVCSFCEYDHICLPGKDYGEGLQIADDPEFIEDFQRWQELKAAVKKLEAEMKPLAKRCKKALEG